MAMTSPHPHERYKSPAGVATTPITRNNNRKSSALDNEEYKKTEAGLLPIIIKIWSFIRLRFPWLLVYIGERPPRLNLCGQVAVIYFVFIHIVLSYEISKRCKIDMSHV